MISRPLLASFLLAAVASSAGCGSSQPAEAHPPASGSGASAPVEPTPEPGVPGTDVPVVGAVDEAATACNDVSECTVVPGVCGGWAPTNVSHRDAVDAQLRDLQRVASCAVAGAPVPTAVECAGTSCATRELDHAEWRACTSASDCVAVPATCGSWDAASRASEPAMRAAYAEIARRVRCMPIDTPAPTPVCRDSFCVPH